MKKMIEIFTPRFFKEKKKAKRDLHVPVVRVKILRDCGFGTAGEAITISAPTARYGVNNAALAFHNELD